MDDLKGFKVPVLILSGGEPLLRPDIYDIAKRAKAKGFLRRPVVERHADRRKKYRPDRRVRFQLRRRLARRHSRNARQIPPPGWRFREASLKGIRLCRDLGLKIGVRFTMTQDNAHDLPGTAQAGRGRRASTASISRT
jgi:MoaA/NifB/PqqE/SkfB family radical SAM enzyme